VSARDAGAPAAAHRCARLARVRAGAPAGRLGRVDAGRDRRLGRRRRARWNAAVTEALREVRRTLRGTALRSGGAVLKAAEPVGRRTATRDAPLRVGYHTLGARPERLAAVAPAGLARAVRGARERAVSGTALAARYAALEIRPARVLRATERVHTAPHARAEVCRTGVRSAVHLARQLRHPRGLQAGFALKAAARGTRLVSVGRYGEQRTETSQTTQQFPRLHIGTSFGSGWDPVRGLSKDVADSGTTLRLRFQRTPRTGTTQGRGDLRWCKRVRPSAHARCPPAPTKHLYVICHRGGRQVA
jgi:hypothetical protein